MAKVKLKKFELNVEEMEDDFFGDAAMIGIVAAMAGYHLCWLLNKHFDIEFSRDPDQNLPMLKKTNLFYFPIYQYNFPNSSYKYMLYKLKNGTEPLLPETKQLDYLWMIQTAKPKKDAYYIVDELKNIPGVLMVQILDQEQLKSLSNLLV